MITLLWILLGFTLGALAAFAWVTLTDQGRRAQYHLEEFLDRVLL